MLSTDRISLILAVGAIVVTLGVGMCSTNGRFDDLNRRIDDLNAGMNGRIDDLNAAFTDDVEALDTKIDSVAQALDTKIDRVVQTLGAIGRDVAFLAGRQAERDRTTGR